MRYRDLRGIQESSSRNENKNIDDQRELSMARLRAQKGTSGS